MKSFLITLILILFAAYLSVISFQNPVYANPFTSSLRETIASGSHVYVTWDEISNGIASVMFAQSHDYGNTLGKPVKLANDIGIAIPRQMAVSGNNVYLAWGTDTGNSHGIFFRKSADYGNTFESALELSDPSMRCSSVTGLQATESYVYVFFNCYNSASHEGSIVFRASNDNATTFGKPVTLFHGTGIFINSGLSTSSHGKNIYALTETNYPVSTPDSVLFRKSTDGGENFSEAVDLSGNKNSHVNSQVISNENHVYVIWRDYHDSNFKDLIYRKSDDYGTTFGAAVKLNIDKKDTEMYNTPFLLARDDDVHVSWEEIHQGPVQTQYQLLRTSTDGGNTFGPEQKLTDTITMSYDLEHGGIIQGQGKDVYYVWEGPSNLIYDINGIYFMKSSDGGKTFGMQRDLNKLNTNTHDMYYPQVSISGSNIYVTGETAEKGNEILFISSHDNGTTFSKMVNINNYKSNMVSYVYTPLKQLKDGVLPQNVKCQQGLELVINTQSQFPACVRHSSLPRMLSHGWAYGIDDIAEQASKKTTEIITIGDKIPENNGLVPVTVTEITNHAESLDSITIWTFRPVDRYDDNHITLDIPQKFSTSQWVVDGNNNDVIDRSRMPENFAIAGTGLSFPVICSPTEKVVGDGDSSYSLPITKGNPLVFVQGSRWGMFPDSNGDYSLKYTSLFETQVKFPKGAHIILNETQSCFLEYKMDNYTKAFYTKAVFKMD